MNSPSVTSFLQLMTRYERIIEISQQLNATRDHSALLKAIIQAAMELIDTEAASILLLDPATGELRFEQASNLDAREIANIIVPMEGSIAGWVVTHGEPRVIHDVQNEPGFYKRVDDKIDFETRNILAVPMRSRQHVIGTLEAVNKRGSGGFSGDDVQLLTTLAGQAAVAIENMRLFQQSDFMAEMVHELRTPLAALKTSLVLLKRPDLPAARHEEVMDTMQEEVERLIQMTNDFLDLARLESGRVHIEPKAFPLDVLVQECITIVTPQAAEQAIRIVSEAGHQQVFADRNKIKQVLLNLLTNAIKYNHPEGSVFVSATEQLQQEMSVAAVKVQDTGFGISKEAQRSMFQKFFRVAETSNSIQGTGLGLAIAKYIVEANRGTISLESDLGAGSVFTFTLPLAPADAIS